MGRKRTLFDPSLGQRDYEYNAFGELMTETVHKPAEFRQYSRDLLGRIKSFDTRDGKTEYAWDTTLAGELGWVRSPQGVETSLGYDALGRPASQTWKVEGNPTNPSGAFARFELGNGIVTQRVENTARPGMLGGITSKRGSAFVQNLGYVFNQKGNLQSRGDGVLGIYEGFDYDELHRLERWSVTTPGMEPGEDLPHSLRYDYDDLGNLTGQEPESGPMRRVTYDYKRTGGAGPYAVSARNAAAYAYDREGNQTYGPDRAEVKYSAQGLPLKVKANFETEGKPDPFGERPKYKYTIDTELAYDGFGSRVLKRSSYEETISLGGVYERRQAGGQVAHVFIVEAPSGPAAQVTRSEAGGVLGPPQVLYLHQDHLGSTDVVTDPSGNVVERMKFDPLGARVNPSYPQLAATTSASVRIGFTGHTHDDELYLINMGGRVYDPSLGRFASPDPLIESPLTTEGLNRYAYVRNNPLTLTDPTGYAADGGPWGSGSDPFPPPPPFPGGPWGRPTGQQDAPPPTTGPGGGWNPSPPAYNPVNEASARYAAAQVTYRPDLSRTGWGRGGVGQPGFWESMIPGWGSGRSAIDHFQNGRWGWGAVYGALAVSDAFLLKALGTAAAKGVAKLGVGVWARVTGGEVTARGAGSSVPRVFWSGGEASKSAAAAYGERIGGTTLEMTEAGRALEIASLPWSEAKPLWQAASGEFAAGARGSADVFLGRVARPDSIWRTIERPLLLRNRVRTTFHLTLFP